MVDQVNSVRWIVGWDSSPSLLTGDCYSEVVVNTGLTVIFNIIVKFFGHLGKCYLDSVFKLSKYFFSGTKLVRIRLTNEWPESTLKSKSLNSKNISFNNLKEYFTYVRIVEKLNSWEIIQNQKILFKKKPHWILLFLSVRKSVLNQFYFSSNPVLNRHFRWLTVLWYSPKQKLNYFDYNV